MMMQVRQPLELRANDIPGTQSWLCRTKYKWVCHYILNEVLEIMAQDLRSQINKVREVGHLAVIMDKTVDIFAKV